MGATNTCTCSPYNGREEAVLPSARPSSPGQGKASKAYDRESNVFVKSLSSSSHACAHLERMQSLERLEGPFGAAQLLRAPSKVSAGAALALKARGSSAPGPETGNYIQERIQVPQDNRAQMTELMDALKVANSLYKEGTISAASFGEMCDGIQRKMDNLVCLWVPSNS